MIEKLFKKVSDFSMGFWFFFKFFIVSSSEKHESLVRGKEAKKIN